MMDASEILDSFKNELSESEYENYISHLKFNEKLSKADFLTFNAPNEFLAKFIQTKYGEKIAYFYEVQSGNKAKVIKIKKPLLKAIKSTKSILQISRCKAQS